MQIGDRVRIVSGPRASDCGTIRKIAQRVLRVELDSAPGKMALIQPGDVELIGQDDSGGDWQSMDISSGLGIGGVGSDDHHIGILGESPVSEYVPHTAKPGTQVCPAGTTYGQAGGEGDYCVICGAPADWNSGAGMLLCSRHWDEY